MANGVAARKLGRRVILKSAATLIGASALEGGRFPRAFADSSRETSAAKSGEQSLRKPTIGYMLAHEQFPVPELVELGQRAEEAGFELLATSDHFQPWQANEGHAGEAWVTIGALTQRTHRVWIGTTVTCPTFRYNPGVVAEAFASMSLLAPGRIFLGIGSGEALNEEAAVGSWPAWAERSEKLVEATDVIRKLWTGQQISGKGRFFDVNARLYDRPEEVIPLLMAGNGPKAMRRCGQYADGLITDPKTWKQYRQEFENGAKAAGKNPTEMPVLVEQYVTVGDVNDAKKAAELWRFSPKAFKTYYNVRDPQEIQDEANREVPLEKVYEDWAIGTDPQVHIKKINELWQSGVSIVNIHCAQPDQKGVIEFYGKEVLPKLRARRPGGAPTDVAA